jgi:CXXC-20-CXXC protein
LNVQKCVTCGNQFTWKEVQKAIQWTYKPLVCRKCGTEHKVTMLTRCLVAFLIPFLTTFILLVFKYNNIPFYLGLTVITIFFFIFILSYPYFAKYKASS